MKKYRTFRSIRIKKPTRIRFIMKQVKFRQDVIKQIHDITRKLNLNIPRR
jgi:hypothetical protein